MRQYRSKKAAANIQRTYHELIKEWNTPTASQMIPTRYGDAHVITCGNSDGMPVLMFHGVGDDSALMWIYNAAALGKYFCLYAVDTIGGPGLSHMGPAYNKDFNDVLWIDDIINGLKLKQVAMIGVSHGGYMAQLYALERPACVIKVICISAAVPLGAGGNPLKSMMKIFLPEALLPTKSNVTKILRKLAPFYYHAFTGNQLIFEHFRWLMKGFNNMAMTCHMIRPFTVAEVDQIKSQVVYLAGREDPFMKLGGEAAMLEAAIDVTFYDRAGHGLNHELADEINQKIIDLLG